MKLNDEAVLEPLHLEAADLSSGRRFIQEAAREPREVDDLNLTRTVLEFRGILTRPGVSAPADATGQPAEAVTTHGRRLDETSSSRLGEAGLRELVATHGRYHEEPVPWPSVVWVQVATLDRDSFDVLQKFEGTVLSVLGDSFVARLVDKTNPGPEEEAEIPVAEVMPGDRELVKPGAVFYWVIGYERKVHGQISRSSVIRFQRVPSWSSTDVEHAKKTAETFLSFLDLERANNPA